MALPEYWKKRIGEKVWKINTVLGGDELEFTVAVANDETEIDDLVAFTIDHLTTAGGA